MSVVDILARALTSLYIARYLARAFIALSPIAHFLRPILFLNHGKIKSDTTAAAEKMSDERLRVKLISAGFDEDAVFGMERGELMTTYAELSASGKLKVSPGAVGRVGYDPEVEKEKLAFEKQKWEAEIEEKRQREESDNEIRKQETEERRQREEREIEERRRREERQK